MCEEKRHFEQTEFSIRLGERAWGQDASDTPFQYSLSHLFVLVTGGCILFGAGECFGVFFTSLILGLFITGSVVSLLGTENLLVGAMLGLTTSIGILFGATALCAWLGTADLGWNLFCALLIYPLVGYILGILCAGNSALSCD